MASAVLKIVNTTLDWVTLAFDAPSAQAVVFGVYIGGHLFVEVLLLVVIIFLLSHKSYKPPKRPLTKKEIIELCDEWVPESLIPPITEDMQREPLMLERNEGVHWGIQNGLHLSRSTIVYFKHNDMESLRSILEKITAENERAMKLRCYIVVEAVYQNSGQIAPLDDLIRLKEKYHLCFIG